METSPKLSPIAADLARILFQFDKLGLPRTPSNGLRRSELIFLYALAQHVAPPAQGIKASELSSVLEITPGAVTHVLNELEKAGYVARVSDPADRRIVLIQPTEKGKSAVDQTRDEMMLDLNNLVSYLGEEDSRECIRLFSRVLAFIKQRASPTTGS